MGASFTERARRRLDVAWRIAAEEKGAVVRQAGLASASDLVFAGREAGYRKALVIQATGKAADYTLDAQAMQKGIGNTDTWDAREFAKQVFVPWNINANTPFTHSSDPYVSNPYRIPRFDRSVRDQRKNKLHFDATLDALEQLNAAGNPSQAFKNLVEVMAALRRYIGDRSVEYPLPLRASLTDTLHCIDSFVAARSGGARLQAVVMALFSALQGSGMCYEDMRSRHVNAADTSNATAGDVTFGMAKTSFAIEVKDRPLDTAEMTATIEKCRVAQVQEVIFVIRATSLFAANLSGTDFECEQRRQFSSGLNIYAEHFSELCRSVLTLIGESGRRAFLEEVGKALAKQNADIAHKWAWAELVKAL